ncbi:MAG TPA: RsmE family RNA methyltransferase [Actinomycetota bacterium]
MSLPHFFAGAPEPGDEVMLDRDDARHATRALRLRPGDRLTSSDGRGGVAVARITEVGKDGVRALVEERRQVPPETPRLTVVLAAPKGERLTWAIQKLTEVGTDRIVLAESGRSVRRWSGARAARARGRAEAIAREAAKQSRRARLPDLEGPTTWADALEGAEEPLILLWEGATEGLAAVLPQEPPRALTLAVGPEGGITEEEARDAESRGAALAALGLTILRTETAALAGAAIALSRYGRLGKRGASLDPGDASG